MIPVVVTCADVILQDRDTFSLKLEDTETWLYEEGEDQQKQVYIDKLAELKVNIRIQVFSLDLNRNCSLETRNKQICVSLPHVETRTAHPGASDRGGRET